MRFLAAIGQRWRDRWKRTAGAAVTLVVLSAVAVVGFALLGSEGLAAWKAPGEAEQALASGGAFEGLVDFGAPVALSSRLKAQTEEAEESIHRATNAPLLVTNWKFTQNPTADLVLTSLGLYLQALQAELYLTAFDNFMNQVEKVVSSSPSPFAPFLNAALKGFQNQVISTLTTFVNTAASLQSLINLLIPASFRPPPIPPASPCVC